MAERLATDFAPAERQSADAVASEADALSGLPLLIALLDSFPDAAVLLNPDRQICLANDRMARLVGRPARELLGLRFGEAVRCTNADRPPAGCGTTIACRDCGAARSILASQTNNVADVEECRITRAGTVECLDLRVFSTPIELDGRLYTVFALHDITDEKRRAVLERIFFHDLLNAAGGLAGVLEMLPETSGAEAAHLHTLARELSHELVEEIRAQRDLAAAERGELTIRIQDVDVGFLLERLRDVYAHHSAARRRQLVLAPVSRGATLRTDGALLFRVLGNLVKNALEASRAGDTVTVSFVAGAPATIAVHNAGVMPEAVQRQVFQRSFTTKAGAGHGIGAYSVRLLTERYLGGQVTFTSTAAEGTTFALLLPVDGPPPRA